MHQWRHHLKNYMKVNRTILTDGISNFLALNYNAKRRSVCVSFFSVSSTAAKFVGIVFGQADGATLPNGPFDLIINSTLGTYTLDYEDWGETLTQPMFVTGSAALTIFVTEVLDSTPECECY